MMSLALDALLEGAFDFAVGKDPLESVESYLAFRDSELGWTLSRLVCPASRLTDLADAIEKHELSESVSVSVLGTYGADKHHFETALQSDRKALNEFRLRMVNRAVVEAYEARVYDQHHTESLLPYLKGMTDGELFVELPLTEGLEESISCLAGSDFALAKLRVTDATQPEVADFIQHCLQLDLPFKVSGDLDHVAPNGFLSILAASALAFDGDWSVSEIEAALGAPASEYKFGAKMEFAGGEVGDESIEDARTLCLAITMSDLEPVKALLGA
jgi:hypothetical protein